VSVAVPGAGNLRRMDTEPAAAEPPAAAPTVEPFLSLPDTADHRVVIVGAGFAGLRLARRLAGKRGFQVVLIDRHNYHTFQPLLYQVATAGLESGSIVYPIRRIFRGDDNVHVRLATVTGLRPNEKALEHREEAWRRRSLSIAIVGGGPTGVELAGALAEMRRHVLPKDYPDVDFGRMAIVLYEAAPRLLGGMRQAASDQAVAFLRKLGVDVRLDTPVERYADGFIHAADGSSVATDTVIWTAGVEGAPPKGLPAEGVTRARCIAVDDRNRVPGLDGVYALGDLAEMRTDAFPKGHPMLAPVAQQQADRLADNLLRARDGKDTRPFRYRDKGSMATIGRHKAVVDLPGFSFHGALAWFVWMFVHVFSLIGFKNRLVALLDWSFNYVTYDRSLSLIVRPFRAKAEPAESA
jgi:NADH dehydrogenase